MFCLVIQKTASKINSITSILILYNSIQIRGSLESKERCDLPSNVVALPISCRVIDPPSLLPLLPDATSCELLQLILHSRVTKSTVPPSVGTQSYSLQVLSYIEVAFTDNRGYSNVISEGVR